MNPTLRQGDHEADGWVRYLQELLVNADHSVEIDGDFGAATHAAVVDFQNGKHLQADGVVGNQTWAALEGNAPQDVGTDGLAPHTHLDAGAHLLWNHDDVAPYYTSFDDAITMWAYNVGGVAVDAGTHQATISVTDPQGGSHTTMVALGAGGAPAVQPGEAVSCVLADVAKSYGHGLLTLEAWMPADLGGGHMWAQCATEGQSPEEAGHAGIRLAWVDAQFPYDADLDELRLLAEGFGDVPVESDTCPVQVTITNAQGAQKSATVLLGERIRLEDGTYSYSAVVSHVATELGHGQAQVHATLPAEVGGEQLQIEIHL